AANSDRQRPEPRDANVRERRPTGLEAIVPMALVVPTGTNEGSVAVLPLLHYRHVPSEENNKVFGRDQSFVAGSPTTFSLWLRTQRSTPRPAGGGSVTSKTANLQPTRR